MRHDLFWLLTVLKNQFLPAREDKAKSYFALAVGCFVGCVWWYLHHKYFVQLYWYLVPQAKANGFDSPEFDVLYAAIDIVTVVWQSIMVGFAAALFAPRRPYVLALTAMFLTFACKIPFNMFTFHWDSKGSPHASQPTWVIWLCLIFYLQGPLAGAFMAQAFKPLRQTSDNLQEAPERAISNLRKFHFAVVKEWKTWTEAIGVAFIVSLFWHTAFVFFVFASPMNRSLLKFCILCFVLVQSAAIGFYIACHVKTFHLRHIAGVTLLIFLLDAVFAKEKWTPEIFLMAIPTMAVALFGAFVFQEKASH